MDILMLTANLLVAVAVLRLDGTFRLRARNGPGISPTPELRADLHDELQLLHETVDINRGL